MAFKFKKIPLYIFIAINLIMIMAMNFCAYSCLLNPATYPNWSFFGLMFPAFLAVNVFFVVFWLIFKWKVAAVPVAGILLCAGAIRTYCPLNFKTEAPEGSFKVLSYNTMSFGNNNGEWEDNVIVQYMKHSGADIICMQETMNGGAGKVIEILSEVYPYSETQFLPQNYLAVVSKYPILSVQQIDYESETNCSFAYQILVGKDTVWVINNHFESYKLEPQDKENYKELIKHPKEEGAKSKYGDLTEKLAKANAIRAAQADSVAAFVEKKKGEYVVCCGDFNDSPLSYTHSRLTECLNDAYTRSGCGPGISYHFSGMYFRIDHILCSPNISAYGAEVDDFIKESDHYPISCYLKLEEK